MDTKNTGKKVHLIGLCGKGMSAVARLLQEAGYEITGSDAGFYDPIKSYLERCNLTCMTPHSPTNIPKDVDYIVIGRHAKLTPDQNSEVAYAFEQYQEKIRSYPEVLNEMTKDTQNFVVIGSYGKSTVTALLSWCLVSNNIDTSYMIGALPFDFEYTSHKGKSDYFVLEGDEYPSSNWDETSKFLYYNPSSVLFTSGEHDHVNVFPTIESYLSPFKKLFNDFTKNNKAVVAIDHPHVKETVSQTKAKLITYGLTNTCDYYPEHIIFGEKSTFTLKHKDVSVCELQTTLLGKHNIENIVGVCAFILEHDLLSVNELQQAISSFSGLERRLDKKTEKSSLPIYEGFGSSYAKSKSAIEAIKLHFPDKKLVVLFEPHTFSWRNRSQLHWYEDVFEGTDSVLIYTPPSHGSTSHDQLSFNEIIEETKKHHKNILPVTNHEEIFDTLTDTLDDNSVLLILTSGSFDNGSVPVIHLCEHLFPAK